MTRADTNLPFRGIGRSTRQLLPAFLFGLVALPALCGPVRITHGNENGQGHVFSLGRSCYAYTAGHVLGAGPSVPVTLVDMAGYRAEGRVLKTDKKLDLGLVEVLGEATRNAKFCASAHATPAIQVDAVFEQTRGTMPDIWLDRISSAAGGLDRFELSLRRNGKGPDFIDLQPGDARHEARRGRSPQRGDSGASVWMSERPTASRRYSKDGEPTARTGGKLLGVLSSVEGDVARIVRSDRLHEFIFNALQPVEWDRIAFEPSNAVVVDRRRAGFRTPRYFDLPLHQSTLDHLSFELDLGDEDTLVKGLAVELAPSAGKVGTQRAPHLRLATSQFRPSDGAKWMTERCDAVSSQPRAPAGRSATSAACQLKVARVARGLRIQIQGNPSLVRRISVLSDR